MDISVYKDAKKQRNENIENKYGQYFILNFNFKV